MTKGFLWLGFLCLILMVACNSGRNAIEGSGNVVEETRALAAFNAIKIEGNYILELEQGEPGLTIRTDDNLIPYINSEVKNNTLVLKNTEEIKGSDAITIQVSYPELEKLEVGGAGKISNAGVLKSENLEIEVSGAALVELEVEVEEKVSLDLNGAASVNLAGTAQQLEANINGAGNLDAFELMVRDASVNLSGVGGAEVYATDNLQAKVSGVGGIEYKGEPKNIQRQVSGVGSIKAAGAGDKNNQ